MRILLTGASGLIGSHIYSNLKLPETIYAPSRKELDITNSSSVAKYFEKVKPEVIIHCAAVVGTLIGEKERNNLKGNYWRTNVLGTEYLVKNAAKFQSYLVYISSEIVFGGTPFYPGPYSEDSHYDKDPNTLSWYGFTKRKGEEIIRKSYQFAAIVRLTRVIGSKNPSKLDFAQKILKDFVLGQLAPQFNDQYLGLTDFNDLVKVLHKLIFKRHSGIFHVSSTNQITPYKLAKFLISNLRREKNEVKASSIVKYLEKTPHTYLQFGGLKTDKTQKLLNIKFASAKQILDSKIAFLQS